MRPRNAATRLAAGRLEGAFVSTDIVLEEGLADLPAIALGTTRSFVHDGASLEGRHRDPFTQIILT